MVPKPRHPRVHNPKNTGTIKQATIPQVQGAGPVIRGPRSFGQTRLRIRHCSQRPWSLAPVPCSRMDEQYNKIVLAHAQHLGLVARIRYANKFAALLAGEQVSSFLSANASRSA